MPTFVVIPILQTMDELYALPRSSERFQRYLQLLQGNSKDDMQLPVAGYNPMGKAHVRDKLRELIQLDAEGIATQELLHLNAQLPATIERTFRVGINLADDLGGAWTNRYTTDYTTKFALNPIVNRNFCVPYFWTSEDFSPALITIRIREAVLRTLYWLEHGKTVTLAEHLAQERYVMRYAKTPLPEPLAREERAQLNKFYHAHRDSEDYNTIFNFLYGDEAAAALGYATAGLPPLGGWRYLAPEK